MKHSLWEEIFGFFFKIIMPTILGVTVKIALISQKQKMTKSTIFLSYVVAIGVVMLVYPVIHDGLQEKYRPMIIGIVAITSDRIAEFFISKFNVDGFLRSFVDLILPKKK